MEITDDVERSIAAMDEGEDIAVILLSDILDVPKSECELYKRRLQWDMEDHGKNLGTALSWFFNKPNSKNHKGVLEDIEGLTETLTALGQMVITQRVLSTNWSFDFIDQYLLERRLQAYDDVGAATPVCFYLSALTSEATDRLRLCSTEWYGRIKTMVDTAFELADCTSQKIATMYCEDLLAEIKDACIPSFLNHQTVMFTHFVRMGQGSQDAIEEMEAKIPAYIRLNDLKDSKTAITYLKKTEKQGKKRAELIEDVSQRFAELETLEVSLKAATRLLETEGKPVSEEEQQELLEFMVEFQDFMRAYSTVHNKLSTSSFRGFVLSYHDYSINVPGYGTARDFVQGLLQPAKAETAKVLLEQEADWLLDRNLEQVVALAVSCRQSQLVLRDYFEYKAAEQHKKASLMLTIGGYDDLQDRWLSDTRKAIRSADEKTLEDEMPQDQKALTNYLAQAEKSGNGKLKQKKKPGNWMVIAAAVVDPIDIKAAGDKLLEFECEHKVRYVWRHNPGAAAQFCRDVIDMPTPFLGPLVTDRDLFSRYLNRIEGEGFNDELREVCGKAGNPYNLLRNLLIPDYFHPVKDTPVGVTVEVAPRVENSEFKRVRIIGGRFSARAKERIAESCGELPVAIYDDSLLHQWDISSLRPDDLVLYLRRKGDHPVFYRAKNYCDRNGIAFHRSEGEGMTSVINSIQGIISAYERN